MNVFPHVQNGSRAVVLAPFIVANLWVGALNVRALQTRFADRVVQSEVKQVAALLRAHPPADPTYYKFFQKVNGAALRAPYDSVHVEDGNTLVAYRFKYGYSGYDFDMIVSLGWHERSENVHASLDYRINGQAYLVDYSGRRMPTAPIADTSDLTTANSDNSHLDTVNLDTVNLDAGNFDA